MESFLSKCHSLLVGRRAFAIAQSCAVIAFAGMLMHGEPSLGDRFTYIDKDGQTVELEARLAGSGQGVHALELADGQIRLVPQATVTAREPAAGPTPLNAKATINRLTKRFGRNTFRARWKKPYVIGLVLAAELPNRYEQRAKTFLKQAGRFMENVEGVFLRFAREVRFPLKPPRFPLIVLVFESDEDFERYAHEAIGGHGLAADNIAGFYSALSNHLAIRLSECHTFATPLHEAIHQQLFNRGVFQRLAPVPAWFNEGIATGFEANGERINSGPFKVSIRYARLARKSKQIDWKTVVAGDGVFQGNVLVGEAYAHAWSLHWLLLTKYKVKYIKYVKSLSRKQPIAPDSPEKRISDFEKIFGKDIDTLQAEFPQALETALRKQRLVLNPPPKNNGVKFEQKGLAECAISAVVREDLGGVLVADGKLRNISPIRAMSFHVTVETNTGTYADWHVSSVPINKEVRLEQKFARKLMKHARGGPTKTFHIRVRSAVPGSDEAKRWQQGSLPIPVFGG